MNMKHDKSHGKANGKDDSKGPVFNVHNIYVKDVSLESPNAPDVFNMQWEPKVDFDLQMNSNILSEAEHIYEVTLHLTVTVKLKEDKTAFLVDVKQAGIFTLQGFPEDVLQQVLGITCPTVIFPYARETVSSLIQRAGFPQLLLPAINFEAMYAHQQEESKGGGAAGGAGTGSQKIVV